MLKQKVYLFLENVMINSIKWFKYVFFYFDRYLFQLIVLLKPDFNYCNNFALQWVDKVTTGT